MKVDFVQEPPRLGNQYHDDRLLRSYLARELPPEVAREIEPELAEMGERAGGELYRLQLADRSSEPVLTRWDAWGNRVDRVEPTAVWRRAERLAAEAGLVATAYERRHAAQSRIHQFALIYLFTASTDIYSCPLAMTDGAAATLLASGNRRLAERIVPHLTSRDPAGFWTSGQWMTETIGGSDVGRSETVARRDGEGWRLYGRKWFTSAVAAQVALALARPEGNPGGGRGLALFLVETRDSDGRPRNLRIERLKDKLGTRKLPTAEIFLDGTPAEPVGELANGVRQIATVLNLTRAWNAVSAVELMRRGLALATDFAGRRSAFGRPLAEQPLHADTLAGLEAELEGAFHLTFLLAELLGRIEAGEPRPADELLLRAATPLAKLLTAKQAVAVASEVLESFGGAGYVEDTGLPVLLRDSQVLPIWEGTTNVLALDLLDVLDRQRALAPLVATINAAADAGDHRELEVPAGAARDATAAATAWLAATTDPDARQAGARRLALTLGRALELALTVRHARWALDAGGDRQSLACARRLAGDGGPLAGLTPPVAAAVATP